MHTMVGRSRRLWRTGLALGSAAALALAGCAGAARPYPDLPELSVNTQFRVENLCDTGVSPTIRLSNVPDGTVRYVVQITDVSVLFQTSWRETIPFSSKTGIPEGAAKTYVGPCIGDNTRFAPTTPYGYQHRVEVLAEDAQGHPLAYGVTVAYVESPYVTAKRQRMNTSPPGGAVPAQAGFGYGLPGMNGTGPGMNFAPATSASPFQ